MSNKPLNNKRILRNTLALYVRMFITLSISLFTTRVIFQALGIDDMGVYNVVGGVISMLGILTNTMASSSQRFITFELGKGDIRSLKEVFGSILLIHLIIAVLVLIAAETVGLWFVNNKLIISPERMYAANWVYQMSVSTFVLGVLTVPFSASIIAHEKMGIYAYLSIVDVIMKLVIVCVLVYLPGDSLIMYAILLAITSLVTGMFNILYSLCKFSECKLNLVFNYRLFEDIFKFSGWTMLGQTMIISNDHILNIFLNWFYGTVVNGSRGIALRINGIVAQFVYQFQVALNPPIVKAYASGDIVNFQNLVLKGSKLSFLLMMVLSFPFILESEMILKLWLGESPTYASMFVRLCLINTLLDAMTGPINAGIRATGKVKLVQIYITLVLCFILPVSYFMLKVGCEPYWVIMSNIVVSFATLYIRIFFLNKYSGVNIITFYRNVVTPCYIATVVAFVIPVIFHLCVYHNMINTCFSAFLCVISCVVSGYCIAMNKDEKKYFKSLVLDCYRRWKNKSLFQ